MAIYEDNWYLCVHLSSPYLFNKSSVLKNTVLVLFVETFQLQSAKNIGEDKSDILQV